MSDEAKASVMLNECRSPDAGEDSGTQFEAPQSSKGSPWLLLCVWGVLWLQMACSTSYLKGGMLAEAARQPGHSQYKGPLPDERIGEARGAVAAPSHESTEVKPRAAEDQGAAGWPRRLIQRANTPYEEGLREEGAGWPDGVGDGRTFEVPMTLDYFQGFIVQAGVPSTAVPRDGSALSPQQALELMPHLLSTPVTLGNFGLRRMAAHLLLEVATGGSLVTRAELHARMRRFSRLLVLRPDGYLVRPTTGMAVQKAGAVVLEDGTLRAGRFEVGPFYAIDGGRLFPVGQELAVPKGMRPTGIYEPDNNPGLAIAEGAALAVVDTVEGLYRLVFYTDETLKGLAQLPGTVRQLYENSPRLWEEFRHKPYAEKVRTVSRLATSIVLMVGTSGAGGAKASSWGGKLGSMTVPLLSLSGDGLLAVRLVVVPAGGAVAVAGNVLSATHVLHMANTGARSTGGGIGWPPVGGPGQWVEDTSSMSEQARDYQAQVTGAPRGWAYKVCRDGECANYDGYEPKTGTLLEAKAREYQKWFDEDLNPRFKYEGLESMVEQAGRQLRVAGGLSLRWHVAEPKMVAVLRKYFDARGLQSIEVVYTQPLD